MHLTRHLALRRARTRRDAPERRPHRPAGDRLAALRRADPPQDRAACTCPCGYAWEGAVTTTIACPRCGAGQAW